MTMSLFSMSIIQNFLNLLKKLWHTFLTENIVRSEKIIRSKKIVRQKNHPDFKQNNTSISLKDLEKIGLEIKPVSDLKTIKKEKLIYASQLPTHIFPWVLGMNSGIHLIKFSPAIQSQINSGLLNVTGGVARNQSGQIMVHGASVSLIALSPIILYQIGTIVFGTYHLKQINESLKKINKKLDEISSFLSDKRSAEINSLMLELSFLSKGIIEFNQSGNLTEVLNRINLIKNIRIMNLRNLLHLQKNLQDKLNSLKALKRTSWFGSKKETNMLRESIYVYETTLLDYSRSLLLDIICTEVEVAFSIYNSFEEVKGRLSHQKDQLEFLKTQSSQFEKTLNNQFDKLVAEVADSKMVADLPVGFKIALDSTLGMATLGMASKLVADSCSNHEVIKKRRKNIKTTWNQIKKYIDNLDTTYPIH